MYRMWLSGVSLVTWFRVKDEPIKTSRHQTGLYFSLSPGDDKPALRAFQFPFVAYRSHGVITGWGRTPNSAPGYVVIEHPTGSSWAR